MQHIGDTQRSLPQRPCRDNITGQGLCIAGQGQFQASVQSPNVPCRWLLRYSMRWQDLLWVNHVLAGLLLVGTHPCFDTLADQSIPAVRLVRRTQQGPGAMRAN